MSLSAVCVAPDGWRGMYTWHGTRLVGVLTRTGFQPHREAVLEVDADLAPAQYGELTRALEALLLTTGPIIAETWEACAGGYLRTENGAAHFTWNPLREPSCIVDEWLDLPAIQRTPWSWSWVSTTVGSFMFPDKKTGPEGPAKG